MQKNGPDNLDNTFVVLDPQMRAQDLAVTDSFYAELGQRYGDFKNHLLISQYEFSQDWPTWEVHPHGDEVVCLLSGRAELVLRDPTGQGDRRVLLDSPGTFVIVPANTWHTAKVTDTARMLFITPGEGTENLASPPV